MSAKLACSQHTLNNRKYKSTVAINYKLLWV